MRGLDIAVTALALRVSAAKAPTHETLLAPALDEPGKAILDRARISQQRAALVASLWPEPARQCVARPRYVGLPAPAIFGAMFRVSWALTDARALQQRLREAFPPAEAASAEAPARAA